MFKFQVGGLPFKCVGIVGKSIAFGYLHAGSAVFPIYEKVTEILHDLTSTLTKVT